MTPGIRSDQLMRDCAQVLMRHGSYDEDPDSVSWLRYEATDMADILDLGLGADSIVAALSNSAWWDPTEETPDRAYACATDLLALAVWDPTQETPT